MNIRSSPQRRRALRSLAVTTAALAVSLAAAVAAEVTVTGITEPFRDILMSGPVSGIVSAQKFSEGATVKQGEVILELDKQIEELEEARRRLVMEQRKVDFEATRTLYANTKSVSKDELEKKEAEYKISVVEHGIAAEQLRKRLITAPIDGTISEIFVDIGEACEPRQALVRIVDTRRCYFTGNIEARNGAGLRLDQTVQVAIDTGAATATVAARIIFISPVVDPGSGLFRIKAVFDNPEGGIRPGLAGKLILK